MTLRRVASLCALIPELAWCAAILSSQAASQDTTPQRVQVSDDVMRGVLTKKVAPIYPPLARQARIQGTVILKVVIDKSGNVNDVQLVSGHSMLAPAAIGAVKQWKYQPYLVNGDPVEVETRVQVIFRIAGEPPPAPVDAAPDSAPPGTAPGQIPGGVPGSVPGPGSLSGVVGAVEPDTAGNAPKAALPHRIRVSSGVEQALLVSKVNPDYPPDAREQRIQGVVLLKVNIDKQGNVYRVELISGHPLLAPAAIEAVKQWKYKPYLLNGQPVEVESQIQINFTLSDN